MPPHLLHVITAEPKNIEEADDALRAMRRSLPRKRDNRAILLFCDLSPCHTAVSAGDDMIISHLQSGVMAAENLCKNTFILLVRRRAWDDTTRMYMGRSQSASVRQVVFDLLLHGKTNASFHAATRSLSSFKENYPFVLFSDASLACTPDMPQQMLRMLKEQNSCCIGAAVISRFGYQQSILARIEQAGFSLSAFQEARENQRVRTGFAAADAPVLYDVRGFSGIVPHAGNIPSAAGCFFIRRFSPSLHRLFAAEHERVRLAGSPDSLIPLLQTAFFLISALSGLPLPAFLSLFLPEIWALFHPRLLPGALVRLSLLPLISAISLDAWLCRLFARSPLLRIRVPSPFFTAPAACAAGILLGAAAFSGIHALYILLPVILLWVGSPLILRALSMPAIERIALNADELSRLRVLADRAFSSFCFDNPSGSSVPQLMLAACAGCMLGLLEPDEAARHVQRLLCMLTASQLPIESSVDQACLLCCAQYLREQMGKCDAALRSLPGELDCFTLAQPVPEGDHALGNLLRAAHQEIFPSASACLRNPLEALFLPVFPCCRISGSSPALPFTHPHTFLRQQLSGDTTGNTPPPASGRFLALCAAALSHPFYLLLCRSPVSGPYALVFSCT